MTFTYKGDSTGSLLTRGTEYRIVRTPFQGVDYVEVQPVGDPGLTIKLTQQEWNEYENLDLIE